jgi:hypothetical protein
MAFHSLHAAFGEVIEDLDGFVVSAGDEVGFVGAGVEVDVVDAFFVGVEGDVGGGGGEGPDFDCTVQAGADEGVAVFRVEGEGHDVVCMAFEDLLLEQY